MSVILPNLAIGGYRSFGEKTQYFPKFSKINLFIGQNNAGKSNVLRFIKEVLGDSGRERTALQSPLAKHMPRNPPMVKGFIDEILEHDKAISSLPGAHRLLIDHQNNHFQYNLIKNGLRNIFKLKAQLEGTQDPWSLSYVIDNSRPHETWLAALNTIDHKTLEEVWRLSSNMSGGSPALWAEQMAQRLQIHPGPYDVELIPAVRQIVGGAIVDQAKFDGRGIIDRLAKLQNPDDYSDYQRLGFKRITAFVQGVLNSPEATIEIPYSRDTIVVHMNDKALPYDSLGSGIHQVIILAAAATVLTDTLVCIEEPEVHLNPILQKKLIRYLAENTSNQYFIATHSAALMDTEGAEIYHITQEGGASKVTRVSSNSQRSAICEDLGYHPSDLIQANCVIWVEGPSDRIYLNYWIKNLRPKLVEGLHYSIMFYGGRLASHLTNDDIDQDIKDFISLRRLNQRGAILIDSDKDSARKPLNATKKRLKDGFSASGGLAWITEGREIENYLPSSQIAEAIDATHRNAVTIGTFGKYENILKIKNRSREFQASKIEVARHIVQNHLPDFSILDLQKQLDALLKFIEASNKQKILD